MAHSKLTGKVLVVDDDEGVRRVIARWALDLGHEVHTATQANEAMEIMQREHIDVVVSDVRMPGHDGVWLVEQVRRNFPHTSVVLATGLTEMDPTVTLRPGVVGYIVKPFNRQDLDGMIERGLMLCRENAANSRQAAAPLTDGRTLPRLLGEPVVEGVIIGRS